MDVQFALHQESTMEEEHGTADDIMPTSNELARCRRAAALAAAQLEMAQEIVGKARLGGPQGPAMTAAALQAIAINYQSRIIFMKT